MDKHSVRIQEESFPIVGIGASAGGLKALQEFFDQVSSTKGIAFVIVQHLSPDFESLMKELLDKRTQMNVQKADVPMRVKPNHVYLLPRRKDLIIENGVLQPLDRNPDVKLNLPIDIFFNSLGHDIKEKSVAVILSGSGTDGSRGVRTIKENGGIVFVQSPETAEFDGMPNAAISLNIADKILSPHEIANELNRIYSESKENTYGTSNINFEENDVFVGMLARVKEVTNVDFRLYRKPTLYRRIEKRMSINNIKSPQHYLEYLLEKEEEVVTLFYEFLIGVTSFFRDKKAFQSLNQYVIPELFKNSSSSDKIRIWAVGCSTGEETYSIAILMSEYLRKNQLSHDFKIFASDVNKHAIDFASQGVYYNNIEGDVPADYLERYFISAGSNSYQIRKEVREKILFTVHDITKDPPFIKVDLIVCRNMLIYFSSPIQKKLLINFHFALNNNGYLFLGGSESVGGLKNAFAAIDKTWNIYKNILDVKITPQRIYGEYRQSVSRDMRVKPFVENNVKKRFLSQRSTDYFSSILVKEFAPICIFINKTLDILYINGRLDKIMKFPQQFAQLNVLGMLNTEETLLFRDGVRKAEEGGEAIFYKDILFKKDEVTYLSDVKFKNIYVKEMQEDVYLVEIYLKGQQHRVNNQKEVTESVYREERLKTLEIELEEAREESQILVEQLETANEELQASNEELIAANEELQSTNEELQSVNEELYTVNTELQLKIEEVTTINNDIDNLLKSTGIGTIFLDSELRIRKFTPAIEEHFSLVEADVGRPINNFTTNIEDENVLRDAKVVLKNLRPIEREIVSKDGKNFLMCILPYRTSENSIKGIVITFVDIFEVVNAREEVLKLNKSLENNVAKRTTELKKSNQELERANSYLDSFVFATAHDLRTPVLNLQAFTKLIQRVDSPEEKVEIVNEIGIAVDRLSKTLDGLIEMVDFQKNNERITKNISFAAVLKTVKNDLKNQIDECSPKPKIKTSFKVRNIHFVPAFLHSIIYNLISNAIKYRDYGRSLKIDITTRKLGKLTSLCVADNGIGIDLDKYGDQLFKPFKRLNFDREGRGIGLSIVNEAVTKNGGHVEVTSVPGEGTAFTFYLRDYLDSTDQ